MAKQLTIIFQGHTTPGITVTDWISLPVRLLFISSPIPPNEFIENDAILQLDDKQGNLKSIPLPNEEVSTSSILWIPDEISSLEYPIRLMLFPSESVYLEIIAVSFFSDFEVYVKNKLQLIEMKLQQFCNSSAEAEFVPTIPP